MFTCMPIRLGSRVSFVHSLHNYKVYMYIQGLHVSVCFMSTPCHHLPKTSFCLIRSLPSGLWAYTALDYNNQIGNQCLSRLSLSAIISNISYFLEIHCTCITKFTNKLLVIITFVNCLYADPIRYCLCEIYSCINFI